jgi:transcription elongation regulator 1
MHWEDFRAKFKKDQRFREFGRDDREREKAFKAWLKELGELKRADAKKAEELFRNLLREFADGATGGMSWAEVRAMVCLSIGSERERQFKPRVAKDPRYEAVKSSSQREELFNAFKATLAAESVPADAKQDAEARKEKALAARLEQVGKQKAEMERRAMQSRSGASREEAEREFRSLLIDAVRSQDVRCHCSVFV